MNGTSSLSLTKLKHLISAATPSKYHSLLKSCAAANSVRTTKQVHGRILVSGSLLQHLNSSLTETYAACGCVPSARKLFDEIPQGTVFLWNTMMRMYSRSGMALDALQLFVEFLSSGGRRQPDCFMYPLVIKACGDLVMLDIGVSIHTKTVLGGLNMNVIVQNCLVAMYMNCGDKEAAQKVFDEMEDRTVVSWNSMISGYFRNGCAEGALEVLSKMMHKGVEPDPATVVSVLPVCGYLKALKVGRRVHAYVEEHGLGEKITVRNALVDMYAKCEEMGAARLVFDRMVEKDVVTWTTMVTGYVFNGDWCSALELCPRMRIEGVKPNSVTVASLLSACASLGDPKQGRSLHGWAIRQKLESLVIVETALIHMYAKCNELELSFKVLVGSSRNKSEPWNAVLAGCIHNGFARKTVEVFKQMLVQVEPNCATFMSLLPAYAILADLQQAMILHGHLVRSGFLSNVEVATSLIDIYSKCGCLEYAHKVFNEVPESNKDIFLWSVIIASYGIHGNGKVAVSLFHDMVDSGIKPNQVTFTSVLHACSHTGLVEEGLDLFNIMLGDQSVNPLFDHFTTMVDLLGRAGRLKEAYELIQKMPYKPNHAVWGALLGACVIHGNADLGEVAANCLFELEPNNTGNYVLLGKIYAEAGRWKEAEELRNIMGDIGLRKEPGHSLIESNYALRSAHG